MNERQAQAVRRAREKLNESRHADVSGDAGESARWWGRLEAELAVLLDALDEPDTPVR